MPLLPEMDGVGHRRVGRSLGVYGAEETPDVPRVGHFLGRGRPRVGEVRL